MDYKGLYQDLAYMHQRAINEANKADSMADPALAGRIDDFCFEISDFMDEVALRSW